MPSEINESAVQFDSPSRIHMGLAVRSIAASMAYYRVLFGQEPTKTRPGYAKFEVVQPNVNLSLNQVGGEAGPNNPVAHFGIQVKSTAAVQEVAARLAAAGMELKIEEQVTCCYAVQNKVWSTDPDGNKWEVYVVLDNTAQQHHSSQGECCGSPAGAMASVPDTLSVRDTSGACCPGIPSVMQAVEAGDLAAAQAAFQQAGGNSACGCLTKTAT